MAKPDTAKSCEHRGELLRIGTCNLCSGRGQPFEVYDCDLHGECSLNRKHSKVRSCLACPDRTGLTPAEPEPEAKPTEKKRPEKPPVSPCDAHRPQGHVRIIRGVVTLTAFCGRCGAKLFLDGQEAVTHSVSSAASGTLSS